MTLRCSTAYHLAADVVWSWLGGCRCANNADAGPMLACQVADDRELLKLISEMFVAQAHDAPEVRIAPLTHWCRSIGGRSNVPCCVAVKSGAVLASA